jgi:L-rhamnose isomerase
MALYHWTPESLGQSILEHLYRESIWELVEQVILDYHITGIVETEIRMELLADTSVKIEFFENPMEAIKSFQDIRKQNLEVLKQIS